MSESDAKVISTTVIPGKPKGPIPIGPPRVISAPTIRVPKPKNQSARAQRARQDLLAIAQSTQSTAQMRTDLLARNVPLTKAYRTNFQSWNQVPDASLRSLKRRVLKGQFPTF